MTINTKDINKLRRNTGAGIMDCKKALVEAKGNFDTAVEILRKKGQKVSAARADRATTEGIVLAKTTAENNYGVMFALNCETDFVAKNEVFQQLGQAILETAFTHQPSTLKNLLALNMEDGSTVQDRITDLVGKIGEKVTVGDYAILGSETVVSYVHTSGKLGVLVGLQGSRGPQVIEAGKDIAMQVAAMNPLAVDKSGIEVSIVDQELAVAREQARNEGKPEIMLEKIAQGRLNKFFKDNTLLNQPFVKDNGRTISQYLTSVATNLTVVSFRRISIA